MDWRRAAIGIILLALLAVSAGIVVHLSGKNTPPPSPTPPVPSSSPTPLPTPQYKYPVVAGENCVSQDRTEICGFECATQGLSSF
jgi:hypothetical protein